MKNFFCGMNKVNIKKRSSVFLFGLVISAFVLSGCAKEPLKIGFIGELSGGQSQLAFDARNGVELYVKQINEDGGINGHMVELVVKNHGGDDDAALAAHKEFLEEDVHFVIGDLLSNKAGTLLESNSDQLLFVSPSMSTELLSEKDDYIIRTAPLSSEQGKLFAEYALFKNMEDLVIVYDTTNLAYTESVVKAAKTSIESKGGSIKALIPFDSSEDELADVSDDILFFEPKEVFLLSSAVDTAFIIQRIKISNPAIETYSVSWSMTKDIIENGGQYVEGTKFIALFEPEEEPEKLQVFNETYEAEYGAEPSFISRLAYDAALVLGESLMEADSFSPRDVKERILSIQTFEGLFESFDIDEYGDNNKSYMLIELRDGVFVPFREW